MTIKTEKKAKSKKKAASNDLRPLNFRVPVEFKKEYKTYALEKELPMVELLRVSFEFYKKHHS
jgi:hypothetical protein